MSETPKCDYGSGPKMVFACSGAADVGAITDLAARQLQRERYASMCCVAAIAADVPEIVEKARQAGRILVLDGCSELCARRILESAGIEGFGALSLDELGWAKGRTPASDEKVEETVRKGAAIIGTA